MFQNPLGFAMTISLSNVNFSARADEKEFALSSRLQLSNALTVAFSLVANKPGLDFYNRRIK
jgi:hypothetical protein